MKDSDDKILTRMLKTVNKLLRYTQKETSDTFLSNDMMVDACAMNLSLLGEDANHLSDDCQERYPQIEWEGIYGLRNKIVHDYDGVNFNMLWEIIENDLKPLRSQITEILPQERAFGQDIEPPRVVDNPQIGQRVTFQVHIEGKDDITSVTGSVTAVDESKNAVELKCGDKSVLLYRDVGTFFEAPPLEREAAKGKDMDAPPRKGSSQGIER